MLKIIFRFVGARFVYSSFGTWHCFSLSEIDKTANACSRLKDPFFLLTTSYLTHFKFLLLRLRLHPHLLLWIYLFNSFNAKGMSRGNPRYLWRFKGGSKSLDDFVAGLGLEVPDQL
jgi:hypothetical protein